MQAWDGFSEAVPVAQPAFITESRRLSGRLGSDLSHSGEVTDKSSSGWSVQPFQVCFLVNARSRARAVSSSLSVVGRISIRPDPLPLPWTAK